MHQTDIIADIIQTLAILTAIGASITSLRIAAKDRRNSRTIAAKDRQLNQLLERLKQLQSIYQITCSISQPNIIATPINLSAIRSGVAILGPRLLPNTWKALFAEGTKPEQARLTQDHIEEIEQAIQITTNQIAEITKES